MLGIGSIDPWHPFQKLRVSEIVVAVRYNLVILRSSVLKFYESVHQMLDFDKTKTPKPPAVFISTI